tara:strand:- start:1725 stop:1970 length:246 start_codon:yes stop_codon:yes gene_type:complete
MNHQIKSYRRKRGIPLGLEIGYRNVWKKRMPNVLQMIEYGLNLREIGEHYDCSPVNVSLAMKARGFSIRRIRYDLQLNENK